MLKSSQFVGVFLNDTMIQTITGLFWLDTKIKTLILLVLHTTAGPPCDTSNERNYLLNIGRREMRVLRRLLE